MADPGALSSFHTLSHALLSRMALPLKSPTWPGCTCRRGQGRMEFQEGLGVAVGGCGARTSVQMA